MNQHPIIENAISNLSHEFKTWGMPAKERIELRNKLITELEKENELDEGIGEKEPEMACGSKRKSYNRNDWWAWHRGGRKK